MYVVNDKHNAHFSLFMSYFNLNIRKAFDELVTLGQGLEARGNLLPDRLGDISSPVPGIPRQVQQGKLRP